MRAPAPLSQEFVVSFLTECFDAGLSKEAAAELLQKETVDQELASSPAFAAGYLSVTETVPGQMLPLRAGYEGMAKAAAAPPVSALRGLFNAGKALVWDAPKGLVDFTRGAGRNTATGLKTVRESNVLKNNPFGTLVAGSALTGAGVLGTKAWMDRDRSMSPSRPTPFFSPSGYSEAGYKDRYKHELDSYRPGIYQSNKDYNGTEEKRTMLEKAVAEGKGGDAAYLDLQDLNRARATEGKQRTRHLSSLEDYEADNRGIVDHLTERTADLENQRTAWWAAPRRWWASANGQKPQEYFDQKIGDMHAQRSQAKMEADLAADRSRLLFSGTTKDQEIKQPTRQEIQQKYFQTF